MSFDPLQHLPSTELPSRQRSEQAIDEARVLFGRTLSSWASDVLQVRRDGLVGYRWRPEHAEHAWNRAA